MLEKDFQLKFNKWVKYNYHKTAVFELKLARGKSLPFNAVEEHQLFALRTAKHAKIIHKIADAGYTNPFDSFQIVGSEAFVVVMFYERGTRDFYMVDIDVWLSEMLSSDRKSLTEDRAKEIGISCKLVF